jgi:hypothetical protein
MQFQALELFFCAMEKPTRGVFGRAEVTFVKKEFE